MLGGCDCLPVIPELWWWRQRLFGAGWLAGLTCWQVLGSVKGSALMNNVESGSTPRTTIGKTRDGALFFSVRDTCCMNQYMLPDQFWNMWNFIYFNSLKVSIPKSSISKLDWFTLSFNCVIIFFLLSQCVTSGGSHLLQGYLRVKKICEYFWYPTPSCMPGVFVMCYDMLRPWDLPHFGLYQIPRE